MAKRALSETEINQKTNLRADKKIKIQDEEAPEPKTSGVALPLSNNDYTVGWICAITTEYVAAQAFLDETHGEPEHLAINDNNIYTLGKIGKHNIAVTVLPYGEYGTASSATVGTHKRHSFPNIRIGLMVGIGGGAPSRKHDIRLGDIVVSTPRDGKGGVIQYDFGKTIQDQCFRLTGFLDQPPLLLRTAVNALKAKYEVDGHQIEDSIDTVFDQRPRLRKNYQRPDPKSDILYQADVVHSASDDESCEHVCGTNDSPKRVVLRSPRDKEEDNPAIHYGMIASGNQLMKDALIRDKLAAEQDILCFEMEAAGLMNHFPCLVIRGICDYSDSHKNKKWQGFAAMAAAAYAKDLLYRIPASKIDAEKKMADIISNVQETVTGVSREVSTLLHRQHDEEDEEILDWITPVDYAPQQNDFIKRRQPGTGQWLLDSEEFCAWVEGKGQGLFCPGIPGAGKTILAAIVVDDLCARFQNKSETCVVFVFCNFRRHPEQRFEDLLATLLKQMIQQQPSIPDDIKQFYSRHKKRRTRFSAEELSRMLQATTKLFSRIFIVIDALDECQKTNGCRKSFIDDMFNLRANHGINLFTTSRFVPEILDAFKIHTSLEIRAHGDDVRRYLSGCMPQLPAFVYRDPSLQDEIKDGIVDSVDGMFLLAQLYMASLTDKMTKKAIKSALHQFRKQTADQDENEKLQVLSEAYGQALDRIKAQKTGFRQLGERTLLWITCAKRPLTVSELRHALAVESQTNKLDYDNIPETEDMVSACAGLVTVDEENNIIRLVHYTMQQYFSRNRDNIYAEGDEESMANTCVTYLSFSVFSSGPCNSDQALETRLEKNLLYDYASRNWGYHAQKPSVSTKGLILKFLASTNSLSASCQAMLAVKLFAGDTEYERTVPGRMTAVHVAAHFGLSDIISSLAGSYEIDSRNSFGRTPLCVASQHGHNNVVRFLLEKEEIDVNVKDATRSRSPSLGPREMDTSKGRTPLLQAAANNHESVVKLLVDSGRVDCDSQDDEGRTPLSYMAEHGCELISKQLLSRDDVDPDCVDKFGMTPLSWAARYGQDGLVKLLLANKQVNPNVCDGNGFSPLIWAAKQGREMVVRLLLEKEGISRNLQDVDGRTPLAWAVKSGHLHNIDTLLSNEEVDPNMKDKFGQTPLLWAAQNMREGAANQLLDKDGVDPESRDDHGRTTLSWVAGNGDAILAKRLIDIHRVDVNSKDKSDRTPLSWAAENGHRTIIKLLLAKECIDVNCKDIRDRTPLSYAMKNRHSNIVKLLLADDRTAVESRKIISSAPSKEQKAAIKEPWASNWLQTRRSYGGQPSKVMVSDRAGSRSTALRARSESLPSRRKRGLSTDVEHIGRSRVELSESQTCKAMILHRASGKYTLSTFDIQRTLGTGSFGRVYLAQSKFNQRFYAVKVLEKARAVYLKQVSHTNDERRVLSSVKHPFLVWLWGTWQDWRNIYFVMDFVEGGELFSLLRKSGRFPNPVAKFYAAEVILALEYLHSLNFIYRDLKPENILLDRHGDIKLTDFGFAKLVPDKTWTLCGTPEYLAPEVVANKGYNKSVDCWALGVLIYEMLCGYSPFWDPKNTMVIYENILRGTVKYPPYLTQPAVHLMENLITSDLTKRLGNLRGGSSDIKAHPWFEEINWQRLENKKYSPPYTPPIVPGAGDANQFDKYPEDSDIFGSVEGNDNYPTLFPDF
ncbi:unnamed protein product [Clonostachys byssicola]|uniref:cAMP-dependent protein kinase n=1 Tax=Clonostachys byssicola TaxID=160290 RepID=A0A9N9UF51_9HYPO|nr:unnamed protein product [Clonostachys byssicola]